MRRILLLCFLIFSLQSNSQIKTCEQGVCIYEDSTFKQDKFYHGQTIAFIYHWKNTSNQTQRIRTIFASNCTRILPDGKKERLHEMRLVNPMLNATRLDTGYMDVTPSSVSSPIFDSHYRHIWNDSVTEYTKKYHEMNRYGLIKPGKYFLELRVVVAPNDSIITLRKEFEVLEAKGKLKQELMDFLRVVNHYYRFEYGKNELERMYDPNLPTITWYLNTYPNGTYSAEMFRFVAENWRATGYKPMFNMEGESKELKVWMELFPKINGNFSDLDNSINKCVSYIELMYKYRLIDDEVNYMDGFLKSIEDKPPVLSDRFIIQFIRFHKDAQLTNYARLKQKKG